MKRNYYPGIGLLRIYAGGSTINVACARHEAEMYLKNYNWKCFDWNGKRHKRSIEIMY